MIVNLSGGKMMGVQATLSGDAKRPRLVLTVGPFNLLVTLDVAHTPPVWLQCC